MSKFKLSTQPTAKTNDKPKFSFSNSAQEIKPAQPPVEQEKKQEQVKPVENEVQKPSEPASKSENTSVEQQQQKQQQQQQSQQQPQQQQNKQKGSKKTRDVKETKDERESRLKLWAKEEEEQRAQYTKNQPEQQETKPLSLIFAGHVDHGKSSLSGRLLVDLKYIDDRMVEKLRQEASKTVGESWMYAFAMDSCQEERAKGKTVESGRSTFTTPGGCRVVLLDSPGHKGFIQSMIESAAQADAAVLVTSARTGEFEAGLERSGQTSEHALILYISGVRQVIVAVNKMDDPSVNFSEQRYQQIVYGMKEYMTKKVGFKENNLKFIPISALKGTNLIEKVEENHQMNWYKGPCLIELIDALKLPKRDYGGFTRACVSGKFRDQGDYLVAKVEKGILSKGTYIVQPSGSEVTVINIEDEVCNPLQEARAGENCRFQVQGGESVSAGSVLCDRKHPCEVVSEFVARVLCVFCENVLSAGYTAVLHLNTVQVPVKIQNIFQLNKQGKIDTGKPPILTPGQYGLVQMRCEHEICLNKYENEGFLGRILLRKETDTIAIGTVVKLCYE